MSRLSGSYIETKIRSNIDLIGGSGYSGGVAYSTPGALSSANVSTLTRIGNDLKSEPYSLYAVQFRWARLDNGALYVTVDSTTFTLPGCISSAQNSASIVAANFAYGSLTGGTSLACTVRLSVNGSLVIDQNISGLAPLVNQVLTVSAGSLVGASSIDDWVQGVLIAGGTVSDAVIDAVMTLVVKSKHVA